MKEKLIDLLKTLRLRGMAAALEDSLNGVEPEKACAEQLAGAAAACRKIADRQARSYQYQLRLANFPMPRDLDSFDFKDTAVNETQIRQLYTGEYLASARNIVFVGGTRHRKTPSRHGARPGGRPERHAGRGSYSVVDLVKPARRREARRPRRAACEPAAQTRTRSCSIELYTCRSRATRRGAAAVPPDQQALRARLADRAPPT